MRLERLALERLGPFEALELDFPPGTDDERADVYLLVGPNGSGKSSLIAAIAAGFGNPSAAQTKMWVPSEIRAQFDGHSSSVRRMSAGTWSHSSLARELLPSPRSFWAFAYSGSRDLGDLRASNVQRLRAMGELESLDLSRKPGNADLATWIVNKDYDEARALKNGDAARASSIGDVRRRIELLVREITELPDLRFEITSDYEVQFVVSGQAHSFSILSDGLKSILSWVTDLLMRLDRMPWDGDVPPQDREFLLLLDEIDIHLHPGWQRRVLPCVQKLFPRAQIVASTHSPFVVGSARDARIYPFVVDTVSGRSRLMSREELHLEPDDDDPRQGLKSLAGVSYRAILERVFGVTSEFDVETEERLKNLVRLEEEVLSGAASIEMFRDAANVLAEQSIEIRDIALAELYNVERRLRARAGSMK